MERDDSAHARGGAAGSPGAWTSSISCPSGSTMKQAADCHSETG
jgi:hypothetical protein